MVSEKKTSKKKTVTKKAGKPASSAKKSTSTKKKAAAKTSATKTSTNKTATAKKSSTTKKSASVKKSTTKKTASTKKSSPEKSSVKKTTVNTAKKTEAKTASVKKTNKPAATKTAAKSSTKTGSKQNTKPTAQTTAQASETNESLVKKADPKMKQGSNTVQQQQSSLSIVDPYAEEIRHQNISPASQALVRGKFKPYVMRSDEEYMNLPQREHFKVILRDWRAELMEEVDRTVHHMKDESANLPDPADRATQEEEFNLELRTRDRERKLIKKIDKTLERIEHDDYGYCDSCGVDIGLRRLEARPTANLCIDCKTLDEIKERQFRG